MSCQCGICKMQLTFQAIENVNRGHISTEDKLYQLKALQEANKKEEVCYAYVISSI